MSLDFTWEAEFLTFKLANGSACLTSHRLIILEPQPGKLNKENAKKKEKRSFVFCGQAILSLGLGCYRRFLS
jgi:hypothetical protein